MYVIRCLRLSRAVRSRHIACALTAHRRYYAFQPFQDAKQVPGTADNANAVDIERTTLPEIPVISEVPTVRVSNAGIYVTWHTAEESQTSGLMPYLWLRDHCRCSKCVNQDTMQRAFETFSPENRDPQIEQLTKEKSTLRIEWKDGHISTYSWLWLMRHGAQGRLKSMSKSKTKLFKPILWDASIKSNPPSVQYKEVMASDVGVGAWTDKIRKWGFCFVDGVPPTPEATQSLLERIAFVRVTHYGGFYDFTSDLTMKDTAYTSLALPAHTDTTYFTDPAGLQMFHLLSHTSGNDNVERSDLGGSSLLVDGYACAHQLYAKSEEAFDILSQTHIQWHASGNEGIIITPDVKRPVIGLTTIRNPNTLRQIRWNNDDRATIPLMRGRRNGFTTAKWYEAATLWHDIVTAKENEYWEQLTPGRALIFDNWRVMHGRSAFTGKRRMSGGYINRDDFISRYLNTNYQREEILEGFI